MELDNSNAFDVLLDERMRVNDLLKNIYGNVLKAGDAVSGGALNARQIGEQYTVRIKKKDYPTGKMPVVHDRLITTNFGTLRVKDVFPEGDFWSILATGPVKGNRSV